MQEASLVFHIGWIRQVHPWIERRTIGLARAVHDVFGFCGWQCAGWVSWPRADPNDGNSPALVRPRHRGSRHCIGSGIPGSWPHNTASYTYGCPLLSVAERDLASAHASAWQPVLRLWLSEPALGVDTDRDCPAVMSAWPSATRAVRNGCRWQMGSNLVPCHTAMVNRYSPPFCARRW